MARIPDYEIERLKTDISLLRLMESQGYAVTKQGKDYAIRCPFHDGDDTPSLIISPKKNCVPLLRLRSTKVPLFSSENRTISQSVFAEIEGLEGGAGFMLYIDEGRIAMLESFSHGFEAWPDHISRFEVQDL